MKIHIYPVNDYTLVAVCLEEHTQVGSLAVGGLPQYEAVLKLRTTLQSNVPDGPHSILWVQHPQDHPDLKVYLQGPPAEAVETSTAHPDATSCSACAHLRVCATAISAQTIGAVISQCREFVTYDDESPP